MAKKRARRRKREPRKGPGTLIRGADGALYFLPDDQLEQYVLEGRDAAAVRRILGPSAAVQVEFVPGPVMKKSGIIVASEQKTISVVSIGATRQRRK